MLARADGCRVRDVSEPAHGPGRTPRHAPPLGNGQLGGSVDGWVGECMCVCCGMAVDWDVSTEWMGGFG